VHRVERRYRPGTLVLETVFHTGDGEVAVVDCMPPRDNQLDVVRLVEGRRGRVPMTMELVVRFDLGHIRPWVHRVDGSWAAVAGPDALRLETPVDVVDESRVARASFTVGEGDTVPFRLSWHPSHEEPKRSADPVEDVDRTERWWRDWSDRNTYDGSWAEEVRDSLVVLKGLTHAETGGLVAAATTSLPESPGGERNWDFRFCWLRDATFALLALLEAGYRDEAMAWREWLLRAVAGEADELQIVYGVAGERRLDEWEVDWLPGYADSKPVRVGNLAAKQFQLDVYGEVVDCLHAAATAGLGADGDAWALQRSLLDFLEDGWRRVDEGIWEVRGPRRHFTHSKVMAWVAFDCAIDTVEHLRMEGPVDRWKAVRDDIHRWVLDRCVDDRGVFVQYEGATALDASLLMVPLVRFLPPDDPRVVATVEAIEKDLMRDGFLLRYVCEEEVEGLTPGEGAFLLCSFWLVDCLHMLGRTDDARQLFERLLSLRNDVGLLSEQVDPATGRFLGNIPQAFSHTALVTSASQLCDTRPGAVQHRLRR
jgi:GH15 family glucan-1,4-alpha-glucosidase